MLEAPPSGRRAIVIGGLVAAVAVVAGLELVRPFSAGPVGFDTSASVIHFQRIVTGRHLEAFVTATPKPLLTVIDGALFALTSDWRAIAIATVLAFATGVALGGWFAWRVAGPIAGLALAAGFLGSRSLLADVTIAYAVPFALPLWLLAAIAIIGTPRRPAWAGLFLGLATLARLETVAVLGAAAAVLVALAIVRSRRNLPQLRRDWLILIGFGCLPLMLLHDWLLTGDPFFWMSVSARFSAEAPDAVLSPVALLRLMAGRYAAMPILSGLAIVGFVALVRRRQWLVALTVASLAGGIAALLVLLAVRHTYVSTRYLAGIDLALLAAAAIGAGWLAETIVATVRRRATQLGGRPAIVRVAAAALALVLVAAAIWPIASLNASFRSSARAQRLLAERADRTLPVIACLLRSVPGSHDVATAQAAVDRTVLLVPTLERPRFVVDADVPLDRVGGTPLAWLAAGPGFLPSGRVIVHDRLGDRPAETFAVLEVSTPTPVGAVTLVPVLADPTAGLWVLWVARPGDAAPPTCSSGSD